MDEVSVTCLRIGGDGGFNSCAILWAKLASSPGMLHYLALAFKQLISSSSFFKGHATQLYFLCVKPDAWELLEALIVQTQSLTMAGFELLPGLKIMRSLCVP